MKNTIEHVYGLRATAERVHEGASIALDIVTAFGKDYGDWLRSIDVLPPKPPTTAR